MELPGCYSLCLDLGSSFHHKENMQKCNQLKYPELEHWISGLQNASCFQRSGWWVEVENISAVYLEEEKHVENTVADWRSENKSDFSAIFEVKLLQNYERKIQAKSCIKQRSIT